MHHIHFFDNKKKVSILVQEKQPTRFYCQADEEVRGSCCIQSASERQTEASSHHIFI